MEEPRDSEEGGPSGPRLDFLSLLLAGTCVLVAAGVFAARRGWIPALAIPWHLGDIAVWALGAFGILWGMERGTPAGMEPRPRLRLYRLAVLLSAAVLLGAWTYG